MQGKYLDVLYIYIIHMCVYYTYHLKSQVMINLNIEFVSLKTIHVETIKQYIISILNQ